jgi:energy-coupling factor transporter ATP-binding protein EcfA2
MYPYAGSVQLKGRVGALIEVRAGIHPELTGRENVYLYGSLLGLSRQQVARRFDAIVDFAELGVAIDRQVKHYSTGMQMRLGFAVAAYLEPDILLVDEVLAVGDAAFQQRCLDRMRAVLQNGTTLVLVSHDLAALEAMCSRGLWLEQGTLRADGPIRSVLGSYRQAIEARSEEGALTAGPVRVIAASATGPEGSSPASSRPLSLTFELGADEPWNGRFFIGLTEGSATPVFVASHYLYIDAGRTRVVCELANLPVPGGRYAIWVSYESRSDAELIAWHHALSVVVSGPELDLAPLAVVRLSPVLVPSQWTSEPG